MSSDHHLGLNVSNNGEIDHTTNLSQNISALFMKADYSDITLKVDGLEIPAHKVILAARSEYFRAMLYGGMRESSQTEIELKGTNKFAFKELLQYIYKGQMSLNLLKEEVILDILGLAHQYGFVELEKSISEFLRQVLSINNVCAIFDAARLYQLNYLTKVCATFMDSNAPDVIAHESFLHMSIGALKELIIRDSFYAPEVDIFRAVVEWGKANSLDSGPDLNSVLSCVRLHLLSTNDLLNVVRPLRLVSSDTILDAISMRTSCKDSLSLYRGLLRLDENVAHKKFGSQVLQGEMRAALLDGDSHNYDMERGYTRHAINETGDGGILIKLGSQCIVNHIKMLLWDRDTRSYSYYVEVSIDQKEWTRVVDHSNFFCRSWQSLYFEAKVVRYIRIVGTNNTANKVFHLVSFEIMYTNTQVTIENGLIVPRHNVATQVASAIVIDGVSRSRNALLDGDTQRYDWDSGYTCHQLGCGSILVQLGQPYLIESMRLLLWDCDDRTYSYYIQVSVNSWDWEVVWDKTRDHCRSWQYITFTKRPVVFIRITGTQNSANEVFHCVHFECPAQIDLDEISNRNEKPFSQDFRNRPSSHNPQQWSQPVIADVIIGSEAIEDDDNSSIASIVEVNGPRCIGYIIPPDIVHIEVNEDDELR
uniref:BTB/POZ domain-containing protein 9 n=3 Tax=Clastoptera arizonana TaxID=38151 RepID=A0A1B6DYV4_9HEMI